MFPEFEVVHDFVDVLGDDAVGLFVVGGVVFEVGDVDVVDADDVVGVGFVVVGVVAGDFEVFSLVESEAVGVGFVGGFEDEGFKFSLDAVAGEHDLVSLGYFVCFLTGFAELVGIGVADGAEEFVASVGAAGALDDGGFALGFAEEAGTINA